MVAGHSPRAVHSTAVIGRENRLPVGLAPIRHSTPGNRLSFNDTPHSYTENHLVTLLSQIIDRSTGPSRAAARSANTRRSCQTRTRFPFEGGIRHVPGSIISPSRRSSQLGCAADDVSNAIAKYVTPAPACYSHYSCFCMNDADPWISATPDPMERLSKMWLLAGYINIAVGHGSPHFWGNGGCIRVPICR